MYKGAIIGGTGFEDLGLKDGKREIITTPFGQAEVFLGEEYVFISRHHHNHTIAPHLINYRANVWALSMLEVKTVITIHAVGSITERLSPGTVGIVSDFIDFSHGRANTFYDGLQFPVRHSEMSLIVNPQLATLFTKAAAECNLPFKEHRGIYVTTNGPRLETSAEIRAYRTLGSDYVGMSLGTEAPLCLELGFNYLPIAYSINWACGVNPTSLCFLSDEKTALLAQKITLCAMNTLSQFKE